MSEASDALAAEQCRELPPGTRALADDEVRRLSEAVDGAWQVTGAELRREFRLSDFNDAFGLATRVALVAESQQHHPDMEIGWGRLAVRLSTHSVGGLSRNDFIMAARIDRLV